MHPHSTPKALAQHLMFIGQDMHARPFFLQTAVPCQHRTPEGMPAVHVASTHSLLQAVQTRGQRQTTPW